MSNIPAARRQLKALSEDVALPRRVRGQIARVIPLLIRAPAKKRAPASSRKISPALARQIADFAAANPDMANRDIGARFGVDGGRVSEAINGIRKLAPRGTP